jgi:HD superfamily phosphodiesterase
MCEDEVVRERLVSAMKETFGSDERRIAHAMKVLGYAEEILAVEGGSALVVRAAAILHDIGIHEAERKHGSTAGRYQEIEGPPIARRIMEGLGLDEETIEHVCRIVGSHHSAGDIDTLEFRIVWDADWLVNIPDELAGAGKDKLKRTVERVFKTRTGREIGTKLFVNG